MEKNKEVKNIKPTIFNKLSLELENAIYTITQKDKQAIKSLMILRFLS